MKFQNSEYVQKTLNQNLNNMDEFGYTSIDSFAIDQLTGNISAFFVLDRECYQEETLMYGKKEIDLAFSSEENVFHMKQRCLLAQILNVNVYIVSMNSDLEYGRIIKVKMDENDTLQFSQVSDSKDRTKILLTKSQIIQFVDRFRNNKRLKEKQLYQLSSEDMVKKINNSGIKFGGNLDGFKIDKHSIKIIEFSKIGAKNPNRQANDNNTFNYNFQYMKEDFGRWYAIQSLVNKIKEKTSKTVSADIIVWSNNGNNVKKFSNVSFIGKRNKDLNVNYEKITKLNNLTMSRKKI